jgi:hypothetical protein
VNESPRLWAPAASTGAALGITISVVALGCTTVLVAVGVVTPSTPTRVVCTVGAVLAMAVLIVALVGTWWCSTLRYVLDDDALEMRFGSQVSRLRYNEIEGIAARADEPDAAPTLWPGAHFGQSVGASGQLDVWRATTRDPRYAMVVSARGVSIVLTPVDPTTIRAELIENARRAPYANPGAAGPGRSWLDAIAALDGWTKALLFGALVVASVGIGADGVRFGALQADGLGAAGVLAANGAAALVASRRWAIVARFFAAGALASQLVALV